MCLFPTSVARCLCFAPAVSLLAGGRPWVMASLKNVCLGTVYVSICSCDGCPVVQWLWWTNGEYSGLEQAA